MVRDLVLSKDKDDFFASLFRVKLMLTDDAWVTRFRKINKHEMFFFSVDGPFCFFNNINELFHRLCQEYLPSEFIDSSKKNLKNDSTTTIRNHPFLQDIQ